MYLWLESDGECWGAASSYREKNSVYLVFMEEIRSSCQHTSSSRSPKLKTWHFEMLTYSMLIFKVKLHPHTLSVGLVIMFLSPAFAEWPICLVIVQNVPWRMRHMRTVQRPRWSVTAVCVRVETGSARLWPAPVSWKKTNTEDDHRWVYSFWWFCRSVSMKLLRDHFWPCIFSDKKAAVDESLDAGAEMTEEEWNLRVAELNKHQVSVCKQNKTACASTRL